MPAEAPAGLHLLFLRGRFRDEVNVEIYDSSGPLAAVKLFVGRPPHYAPWAEVFNVAGRLYGSPAELEIYRWVYSALPPDSNLYVEYFEDVQTRAQLSRGVPPAETRLGAVLLRAGFLAVSDMYFPEGGREGGQKIRAVRL
ncbi:hypothetical protein TUZN_0772 [Thermoproteus uzoniensis 768-20]|uniref:Uncharacterized protein n=1 Tax=Thermoproteus uzoniensis (strain 768-20) TaxID=999630 RepID=F2L511_THEU7|nr:DUF1122 family protein [Thermoproteus uzoniensis]AEA12260.1 hypothetical protein TUZN_0772 [Thermoproteus uzoniensis 768-20]